MLGSVFLLHLNPGICPDVCTQKAERNLLQKKRDKVNLAVNPGDELQTELYPRFECKILCFKCNRSAVKGRRFVENKHRSFRDLSAA
jgi:hypothetical protein